MLCITSLHVLDSVRLQYVKFGMYFSVFYGYFMVLLNRIYIAWIVKFRPDNDLIRKLLLHVKRRNTCNTT